jgi:transcriptional regulator with XRE-family HTH domain
LLSAIDVHVGGRIAARRQSAEWSIGDLANRSGLSPARLEAYEAGTQRPTPADLLAISEVLGVTPSYFFDGIPSDSDFPMTDNAREH